MEPINSIRNKLDWFFSQSKQENLQFTREEVEVLRAYLDYATSPAEATPPLQPWYLEERAWALYKAREALLVEKGWDGTAGREDVMRRAIADVICWRKLWDGPFPAES